MHESSDSDSFSVAVDDYLSIDAETSASVSAQGSTATTVVNNARLQVTTDDLGDILEEAEEAEESDEEEDEETDEPSDEPSEEPSGDPSEGETDTETDPEGSGDGDSEGGASEGDDSDDSDGEGEEPAQEPSPTTEPGEDSDESTPDDDSSEEPAPEPSSSPEPAASGAGNDEVVTLDDENSELTGEGDEIVLDVTISGMSITTTQTWGGEVSHSFEPGSVTENVNLLDATVEIFSDEGADEMSDEGIVWTDAYTVGLVTFTVPDVAYATYPLGVAYASITDEMYESGEGGEGGDDGQDGSGEEGDDKNPPAEREMPEAKPEQQRSVEPLAQTGSPVVGLIAAGAAVAAGGGLAAFFARRKKNTAAADESSEG
ncbi:LPXTG cell wall anchor domain-containing protein [Nocardiopsis lucentensis]|uniref:LPXTG cell wall anchor domain-containing protein n=1 Tax=Nocardiopsis lucentensis TaxID=53441 RepID=UPI00034AC5D7|nr:LPXTG cell wall anchor domain-containing protein [Nocardiopsis lucentensis]